MVDLVAAASSDDDEVQRSREATTATSSKRPEHRDDSEAHTHCKLDQLQSELARAHTHVITPAPDLHETILG
jgi:hypothetical protein